MATNASTKRLSWDAICSLYPDRWVALADVEWAGERSIYATSAEVVAAFPDRKSASPMMKKLTATRREVACFWTGEPLFPKKGEAPVWRVLRPRL